MGKARIVPDEGYVPRGVKPGSIGPEVYRERDEAVARVKELEKEIENLKRMHELELENLRLRLEGRIKDLDNELRSTFPLASRFFAQFENLVSKEMEAAKAEAKRV